MNASWKEFLNEDTGSRAPFARARVFLAAFGKHPAWNDHIDDLGFDTTTLVLAKKLIYLDGISSQVDTGAWERLEAAARLPSFDHLFVWQRDAEILAGLMCDSRDGKGRTRYPMTLCAHAIGASLQKVATEFCPLLERAMAECRVASSASEVEQIIARTRRALCDSAAVPPVPGPALPRLTGQPALGPNDEGLHRILYQVRSQFGAWAPGVPGRRDVEHCSRPAHMRVPQVVREPELGWPLWIEFFRAQLDADTPLLLLWPRSGDWADLIAGIPAGADFFALKANTKAMPMASEVPYQISDEFRASARGLFRDDGSLRSEPRTIFAAKDLDSISSSRPRHSSPAGAGPKVRGFGAGRRTWFAVSGVAVLTIGAVCLFPWNYLVAPPPATASGTVMAAADVDPILKSWRELCAADVEWVASLRRALRDDRRRRIWLTDSTLAQGIVTPLERMNLSPAEVIGSANVSAKDIVPTELEQPAVQARLRAAAELLGSVTQAVNGWPVLRWLEEKEVEFSSRGWAAPARELADLRRGIRLDADLTIRIDELLERLPELKALVRQANHAVTTWNEWQATGDPFLNAWIAHASEQTRRAGSTAELSTELAALMQREDDIRGLLRANPPIDWGAFHSDPANHFVADRFAPGQMSAWLIAARGYAPLPPEERALSQIEWRALLASIQAAVTRLQLSGPDVPRHAVGMDALQRQYAAFEARKFLRKDETEMKAEASRIKQAAQSLALEVSAECNQRWRGLLLKAATDKEIEYAFERRESFGVAVDQLESKERFNEWLHRMKAKAWEKFDPAKLDEERRTACAEIRANPSLARIAAKQDWWPDFETVSTADSAVENPNLGPVRAGWRLSQTGERGRVVFEWPESAPVRHRMEFVRIDHSEAKSTYVGTTEMPVRLFTAWCEHRALWPAVFESLAHLLEDLSPTGDQRRGPRTYVRSNRSADRFDVAAGWIARNPLGYYANGKTPSPPTDASPVNYVSHVTAEAFARSLACRLPTVEEWRRAAEMESPERVMANRRDLQWSRHLAHMIHASTLREKWWPDADIFIPGELFGAVPRGSLAVAAAEEDDGALWFVGVDGGGGRRFHHLIGNVAEIVTSGAGKEFFVIGASALSPGNIEPMTAYPIDPRDRRGFSDVGFRIAFDVEHLTSAEIMARLIRAAKYAVNAEALSGQR